LGLPSSGDVCGLRIAGADCLLLLHWQPVRAWPSRTALRWIGDVLFLRKPRLLRGPQAALDAERWLSENMLGGEEVEEEETEQCHPEDYESW